MRRISVLVLIFCLLFTSMDMTILNTVMAAETTTTTDTLNMKSDKAYIVLTADSFKNNMGSWTNPASTSGSLLPKIMYGKADQADHSATPAIAKYGIPTEGVYKVMVHSRDFATNPGIRPFKIKLDDGEAATFGAHGTDGWKWENGAPVSIFKGEYDLQAIDFKGNYPRFDMIVITNDLDFTIEDTAANLNKLASQYIYTPGSVTNDPGEADPNRPDVEIAVRFNGQYMTVDTQPFIVNSQIMVPYEALFEALGCYTQWDEENQTVVGSRNGKIIKLTVGSSTALVNGKGVQIDQSPLKVNSRVLIPAKFVSEEFGATVIWNEAFKTLTILAVIPKPAFLLRPESFQDIGTWTFEANTSGAFNGSNLRGVIPTVANATPEDADASETKPAISTFTVPKSGQYKLWVRSKDFKTNNQGTRFFNVGINGNMLEKRFGTHGETGFFWAAGGIVELREGQNTLELYDISGFFARCDAVLLTEDLDYVPSESYEGILKVASPYDPYGDFDVSSFPAWALTDAEPGDSIAIENDFTKVVFYKVNTSKGQIIQNEIYSKDGSNWVKTKKRSEELGYLVLSADAAGPVSTSQENYIFKNKYMVDGKNYSYSGFDIYKSGSPEWFIPVDYEKLTDNIVKLKFNNPLADFSSTWEMEGENKAPKVSVDATFKKDGYYSIGAWEGGEFFDSQYEFALAPFRVQGKRIKEEAGLMSEQYLFTPMGTITLNKDNQYAPGKNVTKGIAVEPSWIPLRWVYNNNGKFGITMRGSDYLPKASVFAPVFGSTDSRFEAGQSYNLQYRVISQVSDWFDAYKFVAQNLFGVDDYRQNTYSSLNDAIFNTRKLMMDDELGGWDVYDKAYYNMEGRNATSSANPMQALQDYLLTENKQILTRRTIPTIANLLTRKELHFNRTTVAGGPAFPSTNLPRAIGSPISGYNLNVIGGMYEMTRGGIPYLYQYGLEKGKSTVTNSYGNIPEFSNNLYLYKYTGNEEYLNKAKIQADKFLEVVVYKTQTKTPDWATFVYISYYPNVASLVDMYEFTKDEKYLNAAKYVAQWLSTTLWVPGVDADKKNQTVVANDIKEIRDNFHYTTESNPAFWWHGDDQLRIGTPYNDPGNLDSNKIIEAQTGEVQSWIPSRVGLGLEQASTFGKSSNIIMSSWVGDLLKLSKYTGEKFFADEARNAIIGRFSTYSGYYQNAFMTYQQKPEYAKKGPDYTGVYWHHLPPFLAMLEDFLINMTSVWSNDNIKFPSLRQQGYAYFNSNQYGFAPGKFFDENDMWLWLDEGIIEPDNLQIDWLAARKDGVLGLALMNESDKEITTEVSLGEKVPGGSSFTGKAVIYSPDKSKIEVDVINGKFNVTIPAKSLKAAVMKISDIEVPAYSKMKYTLDGNPQLGQTVAEHKNGKAMVLQMTPQNYYAYVYITDKPDAVKELTIKYKIGGGKEQIEKTSVYPYEFIIEVPNSKKDFTYELEITKADGTVEKISGNTISPLNQNTADDDMSDNP